jgi:hypothetical protein
MCVCSCISIGLHLRRVCSTRVCVGNACVRRGAVRVLPWHVYCAALRRAGGRTCACLRLCHRPGSRALTAGVTWRLVIANAPWAGRAEHTSVIDAAGAIYVIGGFGGVITFFNDVWVSTDGGARTGLGRGGGRGGVLGGYSRGYDKGTTGLMQEYTGVFQSVIQGTPRLLCGT